MSHILRTSTEYITAPLADEGNYAQLMCGLIKDVDF